jgi:type IV secretory pathway component VirB8
MPQSNKISVGKTKVLRMVSTIILIILLPVNTMVHTVLLVNSAGKMSEIVMSFEAKGGLNMQRILKEDIGWDFSTK